MEDFLPPIDNSFAVGIAKLLLPVAKIKQSMDIRVAPRCKQLVESYAPRHTILMFNHSDRMDPLCAYELARVTKEEFYFLASREQFDKQFGLAGRLMQLAGTYSVIRGKKIDVPSAQKTISILVEGKRNLVEFPEGDVTGRNDAILPLKEDGIRNMFEAQRQLCAKDDSLYLLPVALYYKVTADAIKPINDSIERLAQALGIKAASFGDLTMETRVKQLISSFVEDLAKFYALTSVSEQALPAQLRALCRHITILAAVANGIKYDPEDANEILLFGVRADLRESRNFCDDTKCGFNLSLKAVAQRKHELFTRDLDRAEQLSIMASTLENHDFTLEIAWRILDRLDLEITGKSEFKGHRTAFVDATEPLDLRPVYQEFLNDEKSAIEKVNRVIRGSLDSLMQGMQEKKSEIAPGQVAV